MMIIMNFISVLFLVGAGCVGTMRRQEVRLTVSDFTLFGQMQVKKTEICVYEKATRQIVNRNKVLRRIDNFEISIQARNGASSHRQL
jgi:hypothetical protein